MANRECIVVLTNGMRKAPNLRTEWKPDIAAHMRILAATHLYYACKDSKPYILIAGGKINGSANPSLASVLGDVAVTKYGIPAEDVLLEGRSVDTGENAEFSRDILREKGLGNRITLVTSRYHLPRAITSFEHYGVHVNHAVAAEDVIRIISHRHKQLVKNYNKDCGLWKTYARNFALYVALEVLGPEYLRRHAHLELEKKGERYVPAR